MSAAVLDAFKRLAEMHLNFANGVSDAPACYFVAAELSTSDEED